jgi:hypothetical protein
MWGKLTLTLTAKRKMSLCDEVNLSIKAARWVWVDVRLCEAVQDDEGCEVEMSREVKRGQRLSLTQSESDELEWL